MQMLGGNRYAAAGAGAAAGGGNRIAAPVRAPTILSPRLLKGHPEVEDLPNRSKYFMAETYLSHEKFDDTRMHVLWKMYQDGTFREHNLFYCYTRFYKVENEGDTFYLAKSLLEFSPTVSYETVIFTTVSAESAIHFFIVFGIVFGIFCFCFRFELCFSSHCPSTHTLVRRATTGSLSGPTR